MRRETAAAIVASIGLLSGCAGMEPYAPTPGKTPLVCSGTSCPPIKVTLYITASPFSCSIEVDPETLDVSTGISPKTLTWTFAVVAGGSQIPIDLKEAIKFGWNANGIISPPAVSSETSVSATYTRPSTGGHHYGYAVWVPVGANLCKKDPWVVD
jgi:hypothetical protein